MSHFGISGKPFKLLVETFAKYPEVEELIIFGNMAKVNYKKGSDIDLVIKGAKCPASLAWTLQSLRIIVFFFLLFYGLSFVDNGSYTMFISTILALLAATIAVIIIRKTKRKYFGIGMLFPLGLFLIVFGGCFVLLTI